MKIFSVRALSVTLAVLAGLTAMAALSGCGSGSGDRQLTPTNSVSKS